MFSIKSCLIFAFACMTPVLLCIPILPNQTVHNQHSRSPQQLQRTPSTRLTEQDREEVRHLPSTRILNELRTQSRQQRPTDIIIPRTFANDSTDRAR